MITKIVRESLKRDFEHWKTDFFIAMKKMEVSRAKTILTFNWHYITLEEEILLIKYGHNDKCLWFMYRDFRHDNPWQFCIPRVKLDETGVPITETVDLLDLQNKLDEMNVKRILER